MKNKLYLILAGLFLLTVQVKAQSPGSFNYQGVARDAAGAVLATQAIGLEFTVHQGSAGGTVVYEETQSATTNQFGLFTVAIGTGTVVTGTFAGIDWGANSEYLDVAMNPTGSGSPYTDMGTQQLLSVPYALYAASSGNAYTAGTGIGITGTVVSANTTDALWNANQLQGNDISNTVPTTDQVLQWNGAAWAPTTFAAGGNGWNLTGNSGTTYGTDFIGTTDDQGLQFKMNGNESGRIEDANSGGGYNTALGYESLYMNTVGSQSAAFGYYALYNNQYSVNNVAVGYEALYNNDGDGLGLSDYNTAVGNNAMVNNVDGTGNTAVGTTALNNSVFTSTDNTAIGYNADIASDALNNATAIGANAVVQASNTVQLGSSCSVQFDAALMPGGDPGTSGEILQSNGAGAAPTWIAAGGNSAWGINGNAGTTYGTNFIGTTDDEGLLFEMDGTISGKIEDNTYNSNTALGFGSLQSSSGVRNAAFGYYALNSNTGSYNVAFGSTALLNNHTPSYNTAVGAQALYYNDYNEEGGSTASNNTAVGGNAMEYNTSGSNNTATGEGALLQSHLGNDNTAMGYQALYNDDNDASGLGNNNTAVGYSTMTNNIDGAGNTALGMNALNNIQTSNNNTAIGYNANVSTDGLNNATAIGYNATVSASNTVQLGSGCSVQFDQALMPAGDPGTSGEVLQSNGAGTAPTWVTPSGGSSTTAEAYFTPSEGGTITAIVGTNIINPSGNLNTLNITMPSSPTNGQCVELKFAATISNVNFLNGTVANPGYVPSNTGTDARLFYDSGTATWY